MIGARNVEDVNMQFSWKRVGSPSYSVRFVTKADPEEAEFFVDISNCWNTWEQLISTSLQWLGWNQICVVCQVFSYLQELHEGGVKLNAAHCSNAIRSCSKVSWAKISGCFFHAFSEGFKGHMGEPLIQTQVWLNE